MSTAKRVTELDGLRGVAILMVVVWHYLASTLPVPPNSILDYFKRLFSLTWSGVDLFFVLSGYLIVTILLNAKYSTHYFKHFYIRRACRIMPLYLIMLVIFTAITKLSLSDNLFLFDPELPLLSYYTFTQNFFMAYADSWGAHWLAMSWSLAVEEQFYIIIPLLVYFFDYKKLTYFFIVAILLSPIFRFYSDSISAIVLPFCRADSILMGGLLALLLSNNLIKQKALTHQKLLYQFLILLTAIIVIMTLMFNEAGNFLNHLILGVFYASLIQVVITNQSFFMARWFRSDILRWFGTRSYAIYIFHQACFGIAHHLYPDLIELKHYFFFTFIAFITTLILAEISFHCIEKPFINFGHRFSYAEK